MRTVLTFLSSLLFVALMVEPTYAGTIYATGQLLIEGGPGGDDTRENAIYRIDTDTGVATRVSAVADSFPPAALAGAPDGTLFGFSGGQLGTMDIPSASFEAFGPDLGFIATGFDITSDGLGFLAPFNDDFDTQQLAQIDLATGTFALLGSESEIGDAIDDALGRALGTSSPFLIGLGSVGDTLYGVDIDSGSLIGLDAQTGEAFVVGTPGILESSPLSGFAAMTGVDEDLDGVFDTLYGAVNFLDDDGDPDTPVQRLGGLARFDLTTGGFDLVGTNEGLIFFGFGANPVPEPSSIVLIVMGLGGLAFSQRRLLQRSE